MARSLNRPLFLEEADILEHFGFHLCFKWLCYPCGNHVAGTFGFCLTSTVQTLLFKKMGDISVCVRKKIQWACVSYNPLLSIFFSANLPNHYKFSSQYSALTSSPACCLWDGCIVCFSCLCRTLMSFHSTLSFFKHILLVIQHSCDELLL